MCVSLRRALEQRGRGPLAAQAWKAMPTCPIGCLEQASVSRTHFVPGTDFWAHITRRTCPHAHPMRSASAWSPSMPMRAQISTGDRTATHMRKMHTLCVYSLGES